MSKVIRYAPEAWSQLNGVFCVYKPPDMTMRFLRQVLAGNMCRDLNTMETRPAQPLVEIEGSDGDEVTVTTRENLADHPLVIGPRHQPKDVKLTWVHHLHKDISGVCVVGMNGGNRTSQAIREERFIRSYALSGILGRATDTHFEDGKVVEKSTYKHITKGRLNQVLMGIQAGYQRSSLDYLGVDPQSQEAYDILSSEGLVRPGQKSPPLLYALNVVTFQPPHFTIEVSCINETGNFLKLLINDIGLRLKSNAVCSGMRCVRYGPWTLRHALLRKHWTLQHVLHAITLSRSLLIAQTPASPNIKLLADSKSDVHLR